MGPELMLGTALLGGIGTAYNAMSTAQGMRDQAAVDQQRNQIEGEWAKRRANEERAAGQATASDELRKMRLAQSRLTAVAGGSGSRADDPGVMDLHGDLGAEGHLNASRAMATSEQRASGIDYQASLGRWTTDMNARMRRSGATRTMIGGLLGGAAQFGSGMATRYRVGSATTGSGGGSGYG